MTEQAPIPQALIRRFDIFAEWNRLKALRRHHMKAADARAYGLAVAKVVAARKFYGAQPEQVRDLKRRARQDEVDEPWWEHLGSDTEFEHKIVERMGRTFYRDVFQPAVQRAWDAGQDYEDIRDTLRNEWNAHRAAPSKRERARGEAASERRT
jgi:cation transport regulator ChaB